jgi:hypothetical protein
MRKLMTVLFVVLATLAQADKPRNPASPYGVCAHLARGGEFTTQTAELGLMSQTGIAWARSDFDWSGVQPSADTWSFEHLDTVLSNAEAAGVQMLPILDYSVSFANPAHRHLDLWEKYVRAMVERYHTRLPVWEVWNEENIPGFWKEPKADDYLPLLKKSYETVKSVDPSLLVALGGTAGVALEYIERLYAVGGAKYFDIMNVHPYSHPGVPEESLEKRYSDLKAIMAKHNDAAKPVWFTEIGWPTQKQRLAAPGLLKAGLKAAKPDKKGAWRILVLDDPALSTTAAPSSELLADEVPANTRVQRVTFDALLATLDAYDIDAVVLPFNELFPSDRFDTLLAYVRRGGILIECGGMPIWEPMTRTADGTWEKAKLYGEQFRDQLRIGVEAWWYKKGVIPEKMQVKFVGPAKGTPQPEEGFEAERFLTPNQFKEGDQLIPLLSGKTGAYTGVAAAVYKFNSDLKGAVIVSALFERGQQGNSEAKQAKMVSRAYLIALRLGVERMFWYELQAPEVDDLDQESHFGVVHSDLSPKPAYPAYKTLTAMQPAGSTVVDRPWKSADGALYFPQWKRPDGRAAGAVWAYQKPGLYKLAFSSKDVTLTSHTGAAVGTQWDGTTCILPLTDEPVYFNGGTLESITESFSPTEALRAMVPNVFSTATEQYRGMLKRLEGTKDKFPRRWENEALVTVEPKEWTSGFFPGSLWYLYEYTQAPEWKEAALRYTAMLEQIRHYTGNHDIGFMLMCSYGNGLRLANPDGYKEVLLDGAAALCTRFVPKLGMIRSWDTYSNPVIIDNMMNLELLMWAAKQSGEKRFSDIAVSHADQTNARHFRPDNSAYHVIDYNPLSGKVFGYYAGQGASADGPWARGQSWGLYGFTLMYRETRKPEYLARAVKSADFLINHRNLPADKIPYWDYEAAEIPFAPRDASAAAIMASALLELSTFVEASKAALYRDTAVRQLLTLSSPAYRASVGENGNFLLKHGVGHLPGNSEIDVPLNYGDYYYLEGLLRFKRLPF